MTTPEVFQFPAAELPAKTKWGGFVYAMSFDNGMVKVGSTRNPRKRLESHREDARKFGLSPCEYWLSPWHDNYVQNEQVLIRIAHGLDGTTARREYFTGVSLRAVVAATADLVYEAVDVEACEREEERRLSAWRSATAELQRGPTLEDLIDRLTGFDRRNQRFAKDCVRRGSIDLDGVQRLAEARKRLGEANGCPMQEVLDMTYIDLVQAGIQAAVQTACLELQVFAMRNGRNDLLETLGEAIARTAVEEIP